MSVGYTYAGVRHFIDPDFFLAIMPNYLSFHLEIVYLSGVAEICVFPANIHLVESELSQSILNATKDQTIIRLPFQAFFILLAYWHSKNN